jgi:hypothetical protein
MDDDKLWAIELLEYVNLLRQILWNYDLSCSKQQSCIHVMMRYGRSRNGKEHVFSLDKNFAVKWLTKDPPVKLRNTVKNSAMHFVTQVL